MDESNLNLTVEDLLKKIKALESELQVVNRLLLDKQHVLDLIPPCEIHGTTCLPHAADWIIDAKRKLGIEL